MNSNYCKAIFLLVLLASIISSGIAARQLPSDDTSTGEIAKTEKVNAAAALTTDAQQSYFVPYPSIGYRNPKPNNPAAGKGQPGGSYTNPTCRPYIRNRHCPPDATP